MMTIDHHLESPRPRRGLICVYYAIVAQMKEKPRVLVIVGPTASGKTSLSIALAKKFEGEIISADSRQVYRRLDIGTGKVTEEEMDAVPHHLLDVVDPQHVYTVHDYIRDGRKAIADIVSRGKLPIIVGGTFFYVDALLGRIAVPEVPPNPELRASLEELNTQTLFKKLEDTDPRRAADIDAHNRVRLIRALEIVDTVGSVPQITTEDAYDVCTIGINIDKEGLRERFRARIGLWVERGFEREVRQLLQSGLTRERLHTFGFEYQLMMEKIDTNMPDEAFIQKFIEKNWQYAKRQLTWLKRGTTIQWFDPNTEMKQITLTTESFLAREK